MFDKFVKSLPLDMYYLGYRVRKDTVVNSSTEEGLVKSNAFVYTYISDILFLYTKEGDSYYDTKLKKIAHDVDNSELCSLHLDYSDTHLNRSDYVSYSKNDLFGVYGLVSLESLMNSITNADTLDDKPVFKYDKELGLTLLEADLIVKAINKYLGGGEDSILCPMIKKDELDIYPCSYNTVEDFTKALAGMNGMQVKEYLKRIS